MAKDPPDQLKLDLEQEVPRLRRRRRRLVMRGRRRTRRTPPATTQESLLRNPTVAHCGLCGRAVTVFEDAAVCPDCHVIVGRPSPE